MFGRREGKGRSETLGTKPHAVRGDCVEPYKTERVRLY